MKYKFNLNKFIKDVPPDISIRTLQTILSFITNKYVFNKNKGEWVEINSNDFKNINNEYKKYLEFLRVNNIIIIDYKYKEGEYSRKYAFNDYFKRYCKVHIEVENKIDKIVINKNCALPSIQKRIFNDYKKLSVNNFEIEKQLLFYDPDGNPVYNFKSYLLNMSKLIELSSHLNFKWLDDCRLYTSFVSLSSDIKLRNVLLNNNTIKHFDIRSSFPLFFSIWLLENGFSKTSYEFKEFISDIKIGGFYRHLAFKLNKVKDAKRHKIHKDVDGNDVIYETKYYSREDAKTLWNIWLNGENLNKDNEVKTDDINFVFQSYYGEILDLMLSFKKDKNFFFKTLSFMEADFIFNKVCRRLYEEVPGIILTTCHDSIYFEQQYEKQVAEIWNDELSKLHSFIGCKDESIKEPIISNEIIEVLDYKKSKDKINAELDELLS